MFDPDDRGRLVASFADDAEGGHWITIGADDDHTGGTHVYIRDGVIERGPANITGRDLDALHEDAPAVGTHRQQLAASRQTARDRWGREAKAIGHKPEHLHQLAAEFRAHDAVGVAARTSALQSARKTIESYGGDWRSLSLQAARGGDAKRTKGIDVAAEILARQHPELFPDREGQHDSDRLFELLAGGNPHAMGEDEAYQQALDELGRHKPERVARARGDAYEGRGVRKSKASAAVDDVPFSDDGRGRLVEFYDEDEARDEAGRWTAGGGNDPFGSFQRPPAAQGQLFEPRATDTKPDPNARDKSLRDLSAVQKRSSDWDMPQIDRRYGGATIVHLPSGYSIASFAMGDGYSVKDAAGKKLGQFRQAKDAADFIEKNAVKGEWSTPGLATVTQTTRGKLFDFSAG
jgi:hypothetical protein